MKFYPTTPAELTRTPILLGLLVVALVYLPVMGGVAGRLSRSVERVAGGLRTLPWVVRALLVPPSLYLLFVSGMQSLNPAYLLGDNAPEGVLAILPGAILFVLGAAASSISLSAAKFNRSGGRGISSGMSK